MLFLLSFLTSNFLPDGSLYLCLSIPLPPSQPLSANCSLFFSHPNSSPTTCQITYLFGGPPSLLKISFSLLLPGDILDLTPVLPSSSSTPLLYQVVPPPTTSLLPFHLTISGPSDLQFSQKNENDKTVCWGIKTMGGGGRGVDFTVTSTVNNLENSLQVRKKGWEGAGWGEVCVEDWGEVGEAGNYSFTVEGTSVLFGTVTAATHSFSLSFSHSLSSSRQATPTTQCLPSLWDTTIPPLYGLQLYPSGHTLLPPSLRSSPLTITTKALSPCPSIGMSKDILLPFDISWSFLGPNLDIFTSVDPNDWADGGQLVIPVSFLEDREAFPMNEYVGIQVCSIFLT